MSDVIRYQGDLRNTPNSVVTEVILSLGEGGTKNYSKYIAQLSAVELSETDKNLLTEALFKDIQTHIEHGQFQEIQHAHEFMDFLGIKEFEFNSETIARITGLYNKYSYEFLRAMTPEIWGDATGRRTSDGKLYDPTEYVRGLMKKENMTDASNETISELWRYREILMKLHYNNWKPQEQISQVIKLLTS